MQVVALSVEGLLEDSASDHREAHILLQAG